MQQNNQANSKNDRNFLIKRPPLSWGVPTSNSKVSKGQESPVTPFIQQKWQLVQICGFRARGCRTAVASAASLVAVSTAVVRASCHEGLGPRHRDSQMIVSFVIRVDCTLSPSPKKNDEHIGNLRHTSQEQQPCGPKAENSSIRRLRRRKREKVTSRGAAA